MNFDSIEGFYFQ